MAEKESKDIEAAAQRVADARIWMRIDEKAEKLAELDEQIASPDFWNDAHPYASIGDALRRRLDVFRFFLSHNYLSRP